MLDERVLYRRSGLGPSGNYENAFPWSDIIAAYGSNDDAARWRDA
jgi:hypothetical protein